MKGYARMLPPGVESAYGRALQNMDGREQHAVFTPRDVPQYVWPDSLPAEQLVLHVTSAMDSAYVPTCVPRHTAFGAASWTVTILSAIAAK